MRSGKVGELRKTESQLVCAFWRSVWGSRSWCGFPVGRWEKPAPQRAPKLTRVSRPRYKVVEGGGSVLDRPKRRVVLGDPRLQVQPVVPDPHFLHPTRVRCLCARGSTPGSCRECIGRDGGRCTVATAAGSTTPRTASQHRKHVDVASAVRNALRNARRSGVPQRDGS